MTVSSRNFPHVWGSCETNRGIVGSRAEPAGLGMGLLPITCPSIWGFCTQACAGMRQRWAVPQAEAQQPQQNQDGLCSLFRAYSSSAKQGSPPSHIGTLECSFCLHGGGEGGVVPEALVKSHTPSYQLFLAAELQGDLPTPFLSTHRTPGYISVLQVSGKSVQQLQLCY